MVLLLAMAPVVVVLQEKVLKHAVGREGNRSNAEAGQRALEAVEAAEAASVAPGLALDLEVLGLETAFVWSQIGWTEHWEWTYCLSQGS